MNRIYQVCVEKQYIEAFELVAKITGIASYKYTLLFLSNLYRFDLIEIPLATKRQMKKIAMTPQKGERWAISMKGDESCDLNIRLTKKKMEEEFGVKLTLTGAVRGLIFLATEFLRQKHPKAYAYLMRQNFKTESF